MLLGAGLLLAVLGAGAPDPGAAGDSPARLDELLAELESEFPDRDRVLASYREVASRLVAFATAHPASPDAVKARAVAAEALLLGGDTEGARAQWEAMAADGLRPRDRAHGVFLLGVDRYLREDLGGARHHFLELERLYPGTPWQQAAEAPARYVHVLEGRTMPSFSGRFRLGSRSREYRSEELEGRILLLHFFRASTPGHQEFVRKLGLDPSTSLENALRRYPVLKGQVIVLGVHLDPDEDTFEEAVEGWQIPWPVLHDGRGFGTPLARSLGIPRAPHWLVCDEKGRIAYLGADVDRFYAVTSAVLKRRRIELERAARRDER